MNLRTVIILILIICFAQINGRIMNKRVNATKLVSVEWNWIVLPLVIFATSLFGLAKRNNWFIGEIIPEIFAKDIFDVFIIAIVMLALAVYRLICARRREKIVMEISGCLDSEDKKSLKLIYISSFVLFACAVLLYISAYVVVPHVWDNK
ncbi:hypothetical protein FACS1894208_06670 [Clostridia bacterium]|nr:hypothetical protein FACS1894208_06670 [Clostridia bacterium]